MRRIDLVMQTSAEHVLSQGETGPPLSQCTTMCLRLQPLPQMEVARAIENSSLADIHKEQSFSAVHRLRHHSLLNPSQKLLLTPGFQNFKTTIQSPPLYSYLNKHSFIEHDQKTLSNSKNLTI